MSIASGSFAGGEAMRLGLAMGGTVLGMAALMMLIRPLLPITGAQFSSLFQSGIRWNGYVALGVISGLHGEAGVALSAVGFAVLVPINNVLSVVVLTRYAGAEPMPLVRVARQIITNPLILSTIAASALVASGFRVSDPVADTLNLLGDATISLGLICVGAALDFSSMRSARLPLALGTLLRLAVMPSVAAGLMLSLGLSGMAFSIGMICVAAPVATSAYILARQLGGDAPLMANLITLTTLLSLATIPLTLLIADLILG
jgi:predicted permease